MVICKAVTTALQRDLDKPKRLVRIANLIMVFFRWIFHCMHSFARTRLVLKRNAFFVAAGAVRARFGFVNLAREALPSSDALCMVSLLSRKTGCRKRN